MSFSWLLFFALLTCFPSARGSGFLLNLDSVYYGGDVSSLQLENISYDAQERLHDHHTSTAAKSVGNETSFSIHFTLNRTLYVHSVRIFGQEASDNSACAHFSVEHKDTEPGSPFETSMAGGASYESCYGSHWFNYTMQDNDTGTIVWTKELRVTVYGCAQNNESGIKQPGECNYVALAEEIQFEAEEIGYGTEFPTPYPTPPTMFPTSSPTPESSADTTNSTTTTTTIGNTTTTTTSSLSSTTTSSTSASNDDSSSGNNGGGSTRSSSAQKAADDDKANANLLLIIVIAIVFILCLLVSAFVVFSLLRSLKKKQRLKQQQQSSYADAGATMTSVSSDGSGGGGGGGGGGTRTPRSRRSTRSSRRQSRSIKSATHFALPSSSFVGAELRRNQFGGDVYDAVPQSDYMPVNFHSLQRRESAEIGVHSQGPVHSKLPNVYDSVRAGGGSIAYDVLGAHAADASSSPQIYQQPNDIFDQQQLYIQPNKPFIN